TAATLQQLNELLLRYTHQLETVLEDILELASQAEAVHARLYQAALDAVAQGKDLTETRFYLCPVCGHIELGAPPEVCPICACKGEKFVQV
ncbi:MAG: rubrerythrin family protein, partial [Syntrophobacteraceae bacterium]|nr:rubrerythrin family protein [Syntrophobacteraceae bacterium]